jgi:uncharacterized membrane protein
MLVSIASSMIPLGGLVIGGPLAIGLASFFLALARKETPDIKVLFKGFEKGFGNFLNALVAMLLVTLYTLLWALLLIVPGIIAALSYSQVFYILAEDHTITASDALEKSKKMMFGYKWKYFCLGLRFIGWVVLCALTLGIGFLWLIPYAQVTMAKFHDDIKGDAKNHKVADTVEGTV